MRPLIAVLMLLVTVCIPLLPLAETPVRLIASAEDLLAIRDDPGGSYALSADVDLAGISWQPLPFRGRLDGGGHRILNLYVSGAGDDRPPSVDGNHKKYDTGYAGLFSVVEDALIENLHIDGMLVALRTSGNCFAGGLAGRAENSTIRGCSVRGKVHLHQEGPIGGVAGLVGFGSGSISSCQVDVELVFVGDTKGVTCEQFLGGIVSNGYADIEGCDIRLRGYASVRGYVHNGGIVGMYHLYTKHGDKHEGHVRGCTVDAEIRFYERNAKDRRAYCKPYLGEKLHKTVEVKGNKTLHFEKKEYRRFKKLVLPEGYAEP